MPEVGGRESDGNGTVKTAVKSHFKFVFLCILTLTIILIALDVYLVVTTKTPAAHETDLMDNLQEAWRAGVYSMLGLIGGKNL